MQITYVAKHGSGGNDDEGAVAHALECLGHRLTFLRENCSAEQVKDAGGDLLLFHHWRRLANVKRLPIRKVFWCFDLINHPGRALAWRCRQRMLWAAQCLGVADLGFFTDGDWAAEDQTGKARWLRQGFDERQAARTARCGDEVVPLLFTGIGFSGGTGRARFVEVMTGTYGSMFRHVPKGVYGQALADLIASSLIVVAPWAPVTDRYWSNRVYLTLGHGGFLLHPWSTGLALEYEDGKDLVFYKGEEDMHRKIRYYLQAPDERRAIAGRGKLRTMGEHTYRHRCRLLIDEVQRLGGQAS